MSDLEGDLVEEIARNTRTIAQLLALSVASEQVTAKLAGILDTRQRREAYSASDGQRSAREVARIAGTTHPTVARWWEDWAGKGLAVDGGQGRMRATLDLELFGLVGGLTEALS